jgi:hypothetical protein
MSGVGGSKGDEYAQRGLLSLDRALQVSNIARFAVAALDLDNSIIGFAKWFVVSRQQGAGLFADGCAFYSRLRAPGG